MLVNRHSTSHALSPLIPVPSPFSSWVLRPTAELPLSPCLLRATFSTSVAVGGALPCQCSPSRDASVRCARRSFSIPLLRIDNSLTLPPAFVARRAGHTACNCCTAPAPDGCGYASALAAFWLSISLHRSRSRSPSFSRRHTASSSSLW